MQDRVVSCELWLAGRQQAGWAAARPPDRLRQVSCSAKPYRAGQARRLPPRRSRRPAGGSHVAAGGRPIAWPIGGYQLVWGAGEPWGRRVVWLEESNLLVLSSI